MISQALEQLILQEVNLSLKHKLNTYTKLSEKRRKKVFKWISNQNEEVVLIAFESQKKFLFKLQSTLNEENRSILYLSAIYLAADHLHSAYHNQNSKSREIDINVVEGATKLQVTQFKVNVPSVKYDKLLNLKNKIMVLKDDENLSFRQIAQFLLKYHRLKVSHSYIATFYNKIKEKND